MRKFYHTQITLSPGWYSEKVLQVALSRKDRIPTTGWIYGGWGDSQHRGMNIPKKDGHVHISEISRIIYKMSAIC